MDLIALLAASSASDAFKADVRHFAAHGSAPRIRLTRYAPPVKVMRLLAQLLTAEQALAVDRITVEAYSGCSDFAGTVQIEAGEQSRRIEFIWDCRWRAEQQGWRDYFGFPDQMRAAHEFGWRCFERWETTGDHAIPSEQQLLGAT